MINKATIFWRGLGGAIAVMAFVNAAAYIAYAGNPLVTSDAWYFIDAFLKRAMESGPSVQDFYVKRDGFDHAQPLGKLILLINAQWWGLDFVFEALVGLMFALLMFGVIAYAGIKQKAAAGRDQIQWLGLAALAASLVTLNCGMIFDWSLVTLTYAPYLFAVLASCAAWRALEGRGIGALILVALGTAFLFDDVGLIINAVLTVACVAAGLKQDRLHKGMQLAALIMLCQAAYYVFARTMLVQSVDIESGGLLTHVQGVLAHTEQFPEVLRIVFGSTFMHIDALNYYFEDAAAMRLQVVLAVIAGVAHLWFWLRAWRSRWNFLMMLAVVLMLVFYGFVAGIVYSRIPAFGASYLNEHRYAVFYLLSNVALVCMILGQQQDAITKVKAWGITAFLVALIAIQVPLSLYTWDRAKYLGDYYHTMAWQMLELGSGSTPNSCVPMLTVCAMPENERDQVIQFLRKNQLNVFSSAFIDRYRLQELAKAASRLLGEEKHQKDRN